MFYVKEPSTLGSPWILSRCDDEKLVAVAKDTVKDIRNYHVLGVDFLYQNYKKQFKGAILNEDEGMNMRLQVAAFLNAMFNYTEKKFLVLILAPDETIVSWHYHLKVHATLKVQVITPNTCPEDFDEEHGVALLLSFSNVRLAEYLVDYHYFSVVVDKLDEVASKLIIRKLRGDFNIGLTQRNFYTHPDQKMQWTMLNWSNPGCVGKLAEFYEIDNDNFANSRDNYRHWWLRLTWNFCETFEKVTNEEKREYLKVLTKWAQAHHLTNASVVKLGTKSRKRKKIEIIEDDTDEDENTKPVVNETPRSPIKDEATNVSKASNSSDDTIIYSDTELKAERDPTYVQLPSMDEHPILNSIIRNFEKSPEPVAMCSAKYDLDQPNCSKAFEDADVLMSIINDTNPSSGSAALDHETQVAYKKEEIFSQIFKDEPCTSRSLPTEEDNKFFQSLVEPCGGRGRKGGCTKRSRSGDIDDILKETEMLLKE